jgi:hypothetical protein
VPRIRAHTTSLAHFASYRPPLGGRVVTLQRATFNAPLLEPPQPHAWTGIHDVAYTDRACRQATLAESDTRLRMLTRIACELRNA